MLLAVTTVVVGILVNGTEASSRAAAQAGGAELTRLLRAMAGLKVAMAAGVAAAVVWRLGTGVGPVWLATYAVACTAMAAGPALI